MLDTKQFPVYGSGMHSTSVPGKRYPLQCGKKRGLSQLSVACKVHVKFLTGCVKGSTEVEIGGKDNGLKNNEGRAFQFFVLRGSCKQFRSKNYFVSFLPESCPYGVESLCPKLLADECI